MIKVVYIQWIGAAFIDTKGQLTQCSSYKESEMKIVDTTGAGDCFTAAFSVAYLNSKPILECMKFATTAAFLCITRKGALPSMPKLTEVNEYMAKHT